ncbi:putative ribonuclease H-like domain-containing protein [Tanacetum coccineum]|uniref:Ribonuclease H-like domain-containing protein n=1 Tax=Tanacetum coccineum TaxID=301880 RepID=A0ABQ5GUI5_9ASTR
MEAVSSPMVAAAKLPVLNPGEFELWKISIELYFLMTDYALSEVIVNGDSPSLKRTVDGVEKTYPPTTAKKLARKNELKARGTLLMALPNKHQLKFNTYKCTKTLMEAIEKRIKEWKTYTLIWRNKPDLDTLSMDDLYNNLKIYESEVKGSSSSNQNSQNVAFVSSNNSGSSNQAYGSNSANTDSMSDVVIYFFFVNQSNIPQLNDEDLQQIDADDLEEMDLKWQIAMLTMRAKRFLNKTGRKINANGSETIGFNKSKVECYNCYKKGHFARKYRALRENRNKEPIRRNVIVETTETKALVAQNRLGSSSSDPEVSTCSKACPESVEARLDVYKKNEVIFEEDIKILKLDIKLRDNALTELRKKFEKAKKERDDLKLTLEKFENSSKNLSKLLEIFRESVKFHTGVGYDSQVVDSQVFDSQVNNKHKTGEGYHASVSGPLIKDWISDSEDENETEFKSKQRKPSFAKIEFVKSNEHVKTPRESVKKVENNKQAKYLRKNSQSPRGNKRNWNNLITQKLGSNFEFKNKACYECGSFNHLIKDCDEKKMVKKPVWNNASRVNHQNSHRLTHPHPKFFFVPRAVLMKYGLKTLNTARQNSSRAAVSVNTARPINTAYLRPTMNSARTVSNVFNRAHSYVRSPFNKSTTNKNSNLNEKVNTVKENVTIAGLKVVVSDKKGNEANVVKALACWVWRPKQKVLAMSPETMGNPQLELQEKVVIDSGCSRHMTGNKSYLSDYKEIDGGFVAFGGDPKGGKITSKGKISTGGLICLFAKATLDESNLWHRRLGHINFKTMNKLVRGNLVKGLPSKIFENNHTCVACQKEKQHKTSCIENLIDLKVKVIRCDNGTEFKNKVMNQFCEMKGIKREFSVARTPQQNGVAERKNRTLIEAARTMLADSKLPTTFWAEAVNTACYVQNRVLVIKPHNKTPYELFLGRKPALSFMRPFGCPVTILNTLDHLGKFDGKADEGFFVGYSTNSKAFRVFNSRTRIVEENLHVKFSEETPNIAGNGPNWLFDIDALTKSMNYKPVVAGNQTNGNAGTKENIDAGQAGKKTVSSQEYILLPLLTSDQSLSKGSKDSPDDGFKPSGEEEKKDSEDPGNEDSEVPSTKEPRINQEKDANVNSTNNINTASDGNNTNNVNTVSSTVNAAGLEDNAAHENIVYGCDDDPNMPNLEEIAYSDDDEDVGAEADMNNLNTFIPVSPIPTTRLHKDHPLEQIIKDIHSAPQTRRMTKSVTEHDYDEVFAPVARIEAIRLFLAYASFMNFIVYQMDVKSAFLYGTIKEEVYVCQPPGFEDPEFPNKVYKVEKALYGLHQAPRAWYETLSTYLLENRFRRGTIDKTLFIKKDKDDAQEIPDEFYEGAPLSSYLILPLWKTASSTLMETNKALLKDEEAADVDVPLRGRYVFKRVYESKLSLENAQAVKSKWIRACI